MSESTSQTFSSLQDALNADEFPEVDLALRRGRHIDRDDTALYGFLVDAQAVLEEFYGRFGCDLVQRTDGYFFLLPTGDRLRKKHLSTGAMLVGQALALLYLDPSTAGLGGLVGKDQLLAQLDGVVGTDALIRCFNPKRRRYDERVAQETVRKKVAVEVRRLAGLGFVELAPNEQIRLRPALLRFAEPVRGLADPAEALAKLVASGEIELTEEPTLDSEETRIDEEDEAGFGASSRDAEEAEAIDSEEESERGEEAEVGEEAEFAEEATSAAESEFAEEAELRLTADDDAADEDAADDDIADDDERAERERAEDDAVDDDIAEDAADDDATEVRGEND